MSNEPLVSVLMTVYNREEFISEAIESVLVSTYTNFELIIVDDGSTDKSFELAGEYAVKDERIRLYRNDKNLGDYSNRNKAASYASGKYIKFLDSDDAIFDWGLKYCVENMELNPEAALGTLCFKEDIQETCISSKEIIQEHFFKNELLNIGPSGTIFRRDVFEKIGFFDTRFGIASDNYINIKLASMYPVVLLPKTFFYYRKHEGQQQSNSFFAYLLNNFLYQQALLKEDILPFDNDQKDLLEKKINKVFARKILHSFSSPKNFKQTILIMAKTGFGLNKIVQSIL